MGGKSTLRTRQKKASLSVLGKRLDDVLSLWIRQKDADRQSGIVLCCSCGRPHHWKDVDMGHFIPRSQGKALRWDERNVAPQCRACNGAWGRPMNASGYALYLLQKHGRDIIDKLEAEKRQVKHWSRGEIESMLEDYKQKLAELG
jgi:5-methylcytosine-specific restriction endonuclease McrA